MSQTMDKILWMVTTRENPPKVRIVVYASQDREIAKEIAKDWLGGNPDQYIVSPLSDPGDRIHINIPIEIYG